ncbi:MAG: LysM peptidoglycan-binding domain-containing protein [Planctomycetota bacterium]
MNTSYKIGLVVAVILLTLVMGYQVTRPSGDDPIETADTPNTLAQTDPSAPTSGSPNRADTPDVDLHSSDALPPPPADEPAPGAPANTDRPLLGPADFLSRRVSSPPSDLPTQAQPATPNPTATNTIEPPPSRTTEPATPPSTPTRTTTPSITLGDPTDTPTAPTATTASSPHPNPTTPVTTSRSTPATTPPATATQSYTVQPRDNFWVIADRLYGDSKYWSVIAKANPAIDPTKIQPGDELRLPTRQQLADFDASAEPPPVPTAPTGGRTYTVRAGDSLTLISQRVYGSARYFRRIHAANRQLIGESPDNIREGMVLKLPIIDTSGS